MFRIVTPVLSLVIAGIVIYFFVWPMVGTVQAIQAEAAEYQEAIDNATEFNRLLDTLLADQASFSAYELGRIETFLPEEIDEVRALADIEALAEANGLIFGSVSAELEAPIFAEGEGGALSDQPLRDRAQIAMGTSPVSGATAVDLTFKVLGSYGAFRGFLEDLEQSLVLMEVVGITFLVGEGELINYEMKVRLFALSAESEL